MPMARLTAWSACLALLGALASAKKDRVSLHDAAEMGDIAMIRTLIAETDASSAINAEDNNTRTPLHLAARAGHAEAITILVAAGASLEAQADKDATPLHMAAQEGHAEAIRALVAAGALVEAVGLGNATPLHVAAANGQVEAISALVEAGASTEAQAAGKVTPLQIASQSGHVEAIKVFAALALKKHKRNKREL
jgi:cytohesin